MRRRGSSEARPRGPEVLAASIAIGLMAIASLARAQSEPTPPTGPAPAPDEGTPPDVLSTEGAEGAPAQPALRVLVIDTAGYGIDPIVARVATDRIRRVAAEMGYEVLDPAATVTAAQRIRMPYPPTPADLWRVAWVAQAHRAVFARVWAAEGRYVIEISVASVDGAGPFAGRDSSTGTDFREVVDRLTRSTLPPPSTWSPEGAQVIQPQQQPQALPQYRERPREELAHPAGIGSRLPQPPLRRLQLTLQTEGAIGVTEGGFYNHLVGVRFDVRILRDLMIGAHFAYTNLQGRFDRVHNLLMLLQVEQRIRFSPGLDLTLPLRGGLGYLPYNGPVVRIAAGLNYAITPDIEIGVDLISATFWILPQGVPVSMNFALEATYRFPAF